MLDKTKSKVIAAKIKKWLETVRELNTQKYSFAISITRLTSLKSLCQDETAAKQFGLYLARQIQGRMQESPRPEQFSDSEWNTYLALFADAITLMEAEVSMQNPQGAFEIRKLLTTINEVQGNQYRNIPWGTLHIVRSGDLLKLTYALQCFESNDVPYWAYKLGREYVEGYNPSCGSGIIPESIPMLMEVAHFWCWHYFQQTLPEKFPECFPL